MPFNNESNAVGVLGAEGPAAVERGRGVERPIRAVRDTLSTTFHGVLATELYSRLAPRDLFSLGLVNRKFLRDIREKLFIIWSQQQEIRSSRGNTDSAASASSVVITKEHSFASRAELAECFLEKIRLANLRYDPPVPAAPMTATLAETLVRVRGELSDASRWSDCAWHGTFKTDPAEIWKPPKQFGDVAGCRFEDELLRGRGRDCFIDWMLRGLGPRGSGAEGVARDWARYIIAQRSVVGREWQWKCDGEEVVGFMVYTSEGDQQLEIRLTKRTAEPEAHLLPPSPSLLSCFGY